MKADASCYLCCLKKTQSLLEQHNVNSNQKLLISKKICKFLSDVSNEASAPEILKTCIDIANDYIHCDDAYAEKKYLYNKYLLSKEDIISNHIKQSQNPLKLALNYAILGNYIDFGALDEVNTSKLDALLENVNNIDLDEHVTINLLNQLKTANNLIYITDNAGEIVLDKLFLKQIQKMYPTLNIKVIVRGYPILNDATIDDMKTIGLDKLFDIISNGTNIPGTSLNQISPIALEAIDNADIIIAKGQGNFETLRGCNRNIFYLFLCKCQLFTEKFNVPQFTPIIKNEFDF